jgi:hypothetical protein
MDGTKCLKNGTESPNDTEFPNDTESPKDDTEFPNNTESPKDDTGCPNNTRSARRITRSARVALDTCGVAVTTIPPSMVFALEDLRPASDHRYPR